MDRLTLSQAQERVAALTGPDSLIDPAAIDWTQPDREAITLGGLVQSTDNFDERANIVAVCLALTAYAAHLSFQEGRAFELAAVQRAQGVALDEDQTPAGREALSRFSALLAEGLHHAEPEPVTPQMGDIWLGGRMLTQIRCVVGENLDSVVVSDLYGDRAHRVETIAEFIRDRRLVERDGKAVI